MRKSPSFISPVRNSMLGDIVASLPVSVYLEKKYPNSYKCAYIDLKCSQIAPFLLNQPYLNEIRISEEVDKFNVNDQAYFKQYDYQFEPYATPTDLEYFNKYYFCEEIFRMTTLIGGGRIDPKEYDVLSEQEKKPYLHKWFRTERYEKTIALFPFVGYGTNDPSIKLRSPSMKWVKNLVYRLLDLGYKVNQYGHPNSELIDLCGVEDRRNLSLFDMIKESLGCDFSIGNDSGSSWLLGAYGVNQILLYTNYKNNHFTNYSAICPVNYSNNCQYLYGAGGIDNINVEDVLDAVKKYKIN